MDKATRGCRAPSLTEECIVRIAEDLSRRFRHLKSDLPFDLFTFDFDTAFNDVIYPEFEVDIREDIDLGYDENHAKIFGYYDPVDHAIYLDPILSNYLKTRFRVSRQ